MRSFVFFAAGMLTATGAGQHGARAQSADLGCSSFPTAALTRTLTCPGGVTVVAENGAQFTLLDRDRNGQVDGVDLKSKAVLVNVPKQKAGRRFEVLTPQAIAAVRGTRWAVDAEGSKTSVFVESGLVGVSRRSRAGRVTNQVTLGAGEGVDVDATTPLEVKRWGAPRIAALAARLGL